MSSVARRIVILVTTMDDATDAQDAGHAVAEELRPALVTVVEYDAAGRQAVGAPITTLEDAGG